MSESYFFVAVPRYLKVEHAFAKTIKPNTKYRLVLYKGIQKCDQMKEAIKSKLIGGKIDLQSPELSFNIPYYTPTKNIQFTIKLYEQKPNEAETEIASYSIMSSDYIKIFKNDKQSLFQVDGQFQPDLSIGLDLYVEKSKVLVSEAVKKIVSSPVKISKQIPQDMKSQSSKSKQIVRNGDGFISPRRRLQRKRGHEGQLRSRNTSRQRSQHSADGSVTSSRRKWKKSPPSQGQHFMHSPKKAISPKVSEAQKGKSQPKSDAAKSIGKKSQSNIKQQVNQKAYKYEPGAGKLKYVDTKQVFDLRVQRQTSPSKSQVIQRTNPVQKTPISRSGVVSPPNNKNDKISSASRTSLVQPPPSQSSIPNIGSRSNLKSPVTSPKNANSQASLGQFEVKHTAQVFDVVKKGATSPKNTIDKAIPTPGKSANSPSKYQPVRSPKNITNPVVVQKAAEVKQKELPNRISENSKSQKSLGQSQSKVSQSRLGVEVKQDDKSMNQSNIKIAMDGSIYSPKAQLIQRDDKSTSHKGQDISVKRQPIKKQKGTLHDEDTLRGSIRLKEADTLKQKEEQHKSEQKAAAQRKMTILYFIFLIISAFLIYFVMHPTRRV